MLVVACGNQGEKVDRLQGDLTLHQALKRVAEEGDCADTARSLLGEGGMKRYLPLLILAASFCLVQPLVANEQFNQGMNLSNQNKGQGASAIQGFNPAEVIPGYTNSLLKAGITVA